MKVENQLLISGWLPSVLGWGWYIHQVLRNRKIAKPQIWLLFHVDTKSLIYYYILFESFSSLISLTWFMNLLRWSNSQPTPFCSSRCDRCSGFYCSKHKGKAVIPAKFRAFVGLAIAMGWQEHLQTWTQPWILNKFDENCSSSTEVSQCLCLSLIESRSQHCQLSCEWSGLYKLGSCESMAQRIPCQVHNCEVMKEIIKAKVRKVHQDMEQMVFLRKWKHMLHKMLNKYVTMFLCLKA